MKVSFRVVGAIAAAMAVAGPAPSRAAPAGSARAPAAAPSSPPAATPQQPSGTHAPAADKPAPTVPQVSQDAAARTRMRECGHQWSAMKKAGQVGTMTWKEFSATCLVVSR